MAGGNTVEIILSAADRASGTIRETFGTVEQSSNRAMGIVKAGAALAVSAMAAAGGYVAKLGVDYNAMAEQSQVAWTTLLGSQEKAKNMLQDIANFAKSTPFETSSVDAMAKYMHNAGLEGKAMFDQLMKISDVASAFNIPADSAQELARQMSQVMQAGVAYTEDLNILGDRGVPIYQALAKELKTNVANVKQMASQGKITSDIYLKAFSDISNGVKGASDAQSQTFSGMLSTLSDNLQMLSGALAQPLFNGLKDGLNMIMPLLGGLTSLAKGDFKGFSDTINQTFGSDTGSKVISFAQNLMNGFGQIGGYIDKAKQAISGIFNLTAGNEGKGVSILANLGLSSDAVGNVIGVLNGIKSTVLGYFNFIKAVFSGNNSLGESFGKIFNTAKSIVMPIINDIVSFFREKFAMIKQFWDENGAQIIQAVKNFFAIIAAIFQFLAPVILFIIKMVWDSVKGVIDGALKVIMGLIKVFAGLFTGDFGKMWEGIKQIFFGAIELVWNLINLLFVGRILGGIKAFITEGITHFTGFWTKAWEIFKNIDTTISGTVSGFIGKVIGFIRDLWTNAVNIFNQLRTFGANIFESLWQAITNTAGRIAAGVKGFFGDMVTGAKWQIQNLLDSASGIFNGIKNAITDPIGTAKDIVIGFIDKIKSAFSNMGVKISLPHFSVSNFSLNPKDWIDHGLPKLSVDWYDRGGVFYGPQVIGVGEKRPEFVGALDDLRKIVREETGGRTYNVTVNAGKVDMDEYQLVRTLKRLEVLYG
jgi:tape measure domain-containing protein